MTEIIPTYTTLKRVNKEDRQTILDALRNNKRKARGRLKDESGGRCCLRVIEENFVPYDNWTNGHAGCPYTLPFINGVDDETDFQIGQYARDVNVCGEEKHVVLEMVQVSELNDGIDKTKDFSFLGVRMPKRKGKNIGYSHKQIADFFEQMWKDIDEEG